MKAFNVFSLWDIRCRVSIFWSLFWVHVLMLSSPHQCPPPLLVAQPLCACFISGGNYHIVEVLNFYCGFIPVGFRLIYLTWLNESWVNRNILKVPWVDVENYYDEKQLLCYNKKLLYLGFLNMSQL